MNATTASGRTVRLSFEGTNLVATMEGKGGTVVVDDVRLRTTGRAPVLQGGTWYGAHIYAERGWTLTTSEYTLCFERLEDAVAYYAEGVLS